MMEPVLKFRELDLILDSLLARIEKVHVIMDSQMTNWLTPEIQQYRVSYLNSQYRYKKFIEQQMLEIIDQVDINDIISSVKQE